jgi:hypothetical protein
VPARYESREKQTEWTSYVRYCRYKRSDTQNELPYAR